MTYLLLARKYWKLAALGLLLLALAVQTVRLGNAHNQIEKRDIRINELRAELKSISDARNEQKIVTVERIKEVVKLRRVAEKEAERIETAPLPGNCSTPKEIMESYEL